MRLGRTLMEMEMKIEDHDPYNRNATVPYNISPTTLGLITIEGDRRLSSTTKTAGRYATRIRDLWDGKRLIHSATAANESHGENDCRILGIQSTAACNGPSFGWHRGMSMILAVSFLSYHTCVQLSVLTIY